MVDLFERNIAFDHQTKHLLTENSRSTKNIPVLLVSLYIQNNTCPNNLMLIAQISAMRMPEEDGVIAEWLKQISQN